MRCSGTFLSGRCVESLPSELEEGARLILIVDKKKNEAIGVAEAWAGFLEGVKKHPLPEELGMPEKLDLRRDLDI